MQVNVVTDILSANDRIALENRAELDDHGILAVNLMASPGAGKTSLILRTAEALAGRLRLGVIEGDVASRVDADKVAAHGIPVVQIHTGGCHLDAPMVRAALPQLPLDRIDLLLIENVGNLICPVEFRLGEHLRVVISSLPEGHDKPYKYPGIFTVVDAVVINKADLAPYVDFDMADFRRVVGGLNPSAQFFPVSCRTGEGVSAWADWLAERQSQMREQA